jgi:hypothetical protein
VTATSDETRRTARCKALSHLGDTLLAEARSMEGRAADELFKSACATYGEALALDPDMAEALVGLGRARLALAGRTAGRAARENLLRLARRALLRAEQLQAGVAAYDLACVCARDGDIEGCRSWLEKSKADLQLPPAGELYADPDLAAVRGEPWLEKLINEII